MNIKNKITQTPETLGANLTKQAQDLYPKNGTILMKETKDLKTSRETFYVNEWEIQQSIRMSILLLLNINTGV